MVAACGEEGKRLKKGGSGEKGTCEIKTGLTRVAREVERLVDTG